MIYSEKHNNNIRDCFFFRNNGLHYFIVIFYATLLGEAFALFAGFVNQC